MADDKAADEYKRQGILKTNGKFNAGRRGSLYVNLAMPNRPNRPTVPDEDDGGHNNDILDSEYFPSDVVQNVLNSVRDKAHKSRNIFCEMDTLKKFNDNWEWRETARWVKFEETVEEGGKRWSKPHVASLSMHSILETRKMLMDGLLMLDLDVYSMSELTDQVIEALVKKGMLDERLRQHMHNITLVKHKHKHYPRNKSEKDLMKKGLPSSASLSNISESSSATDLEGLVSADYKPNSAFMRKIPKGSEVCNIMVGEVEELKEPILAVIRLKEARIMEGISEVKLPSRFVAFIFCPKHSINQHEIGRCLATMVIDEVFREVAYKSRNITELIAGLDEFVEQVTVLPPGEWDKKIRIEPPQKVQSQVHRKKSLANFDADEEEEDEGGHGDDPTLQMSKIPFSGLVADIKRKIPWYWSDYKDSLHIQCFAAFVYVFLGTFTPNVTFGGLLGQATDQYMGVMECIFAAAVTGILFALFSGQPLNILGSTGPMLVLETIIYNLCKDNDWDFMPARVWIGLWTSGIILLIVVFNLSALVKYITRFTEESFATLIAVIFIVEAFKKLFQIEDDYPMNTTGVVPSTNCSCVAPDCSNLTAAVVNATMSKKNLTEVCANLTAISATNVTIDWPFLGGAECVKYGGDAFGDGCFPPIYKPDAFLFSVILFAGTFGIAITLKDFRMSTILPTFIRSFISDFAVLISIIVFVVFDMVVGLDTPKLIVPDKFQPTRSDRGWFINPVSDKNPWWLAIAAALPALLCVILIFLDQQITAVIVNRKENKLKKGVGYHLDMFVVAITVAIHSILGLPWYVAATVSALAHIDSLKKSSECTAPGEKPSFLGVREQRVTALFIGILSGAAVFITAILKVIPMAVLYGVFFYMGYSAMRGMQFVDRLFLFIQPVKYQPDLPYLRHVQLYRVHIFTILQVVCLGVLWAVKSVKSISIGFPLMVLATGVVRKAMECGYSNMELKWLDDLLPGQSAKPHGDREAIISKFNEAFSHSQTGGMNGINGKSSYDTNGTTPTEKKKKPLFFVEEEGEQNDHRNSTKASTNL